MPSMKSISDIRHAAEVYHAAVHLPLAWDDVCGENFALRRAFLQMMEEANPCGQRYYGFRDVKGQLDSIIMTLEQPRLDLGMFTPVRWPIPVTLVYVPLSASTPGMVCGAATRKAVECFLAGLRGFTLVLNLPEDQRLPGFARALTCPRIHLRLRWSSFDDYLADLRSHYRRRYRLAQGKTGDITLQQIVPGDFTARHYALYEQVFHRSRIQVEKLSLCYFQRCPASILVYERQGEPVGFVQLIANGAELVFGFIGLDYAVNERYDLYINLLLRMVAYGIEGGFSSIDLGQTADDTKLKLGGEYELLYAHMRHHHPLIHGILQRLLPHIGYHPLPQQFHVFKSSTPGEARAHPACPSQTA